MRDESTASATGGTGSIDTGPTTRSAHGAAAAKRIPERALSSPGSASPSDSSTAGLTVAAEQPTPPEHFDVVIPVWGAHTDLFLRCSLPAQLSGRNLPALAARYPVTYRILTRESDADRILDAPVVEKLARHASVDVVRMDTRGDAYSAMTACHREAISRALPRTALVFMNADLVAADGTFARLAELAARGARAVLCSAVRLRATDTAAQIERQPELSPRGLAALALDHLHPAMEAHAFDADGASDALIPAMMTWRVDREGLLLRCFHLHPLMIHADRADVAFRGTIDDDYIERACPDAAKIHVVVDSDELMLAELSPDTHRGGGAIPRSSWIALGAWVNRCTHPLHRALATRAIALHRGDITEPAWARARVDSDVVITRALRVSRMLPRALPLSLALPAGQLERWTHRLARWLVRPGATARTP